jgi:hypothetical protein
VKRRIEVCEAGLKLDDDPHAADRLGTAAALWVFGYRTHTLARQEGREKALVDNVQRLCAITVSTPAEHVEKAGMCARVIAILDRVKSSDATKPSLDQTRRLCGETASASLRKAFELGFRDVDALRNGPDSHAFLSQPELREIILSHVARPREK